MRILKHTSRFGPRRGRCFSTGAGPCPFDGFVTQADLREQSSRFAPRWCSPGASRVDEVFRPLLFPSSGSMFVAMLFSTGRPTVAENASCSLTAAMLMYAIIPRTIVINLGARPALSHPRERAEISNIFKILGGSPLRRSFYSFDEVCGTMDRCKRSLFSVPVDYKMRRPLSL